MRARKKTKLVLGRETLIELDARALLAAAGGADAGVLPFPTRKADCERTQAACPPTGGTPW
jgi:hypothetical protein